MATARNLERHLEKLVVGRLLVFEVIEEHEAQLAADGLGAICTVLRAGAIEHTALELDGWLTSESLGEFLAGMVEELRHRTKKLRAKAPAPCDALLAQLDARASALGAMGTDPLTSIFDEAMRVTAAVHTECGIDPVPVTGRCPRFQVAHVSGDGGMLRAPYWVSGGTDLAVARFGVTADVALLLHAEHFAWESYLAVPYVLFHECVCHLFTTRREVPAASDRFAEGWMDFVAWMLQDAALADTPSFGAWPAVPAARRRLHRSVAWQLALQRTGADRRDPSWASRKIGFDAALRLRTALARMWAPADADLAFWRCSMHLNWSDVPYPTLSTLATLVCYAPETAEVDAFLADGAGQVRSTADATTFVDRVFDLLDKKRTMRDTGRQAGP